MSTVEAATGLVRVGVLGPLTVTISGQTLPLTASKERGVLALLAIRGGAVASVYDLTAALWGDDPPDTATKAIQTYVSNLRRRLPTGIIETIAPGYRSTIGPEDVDSIQFERLVRNALSNLAQDPERQAEALQAALGVWRGPALVDLAHHELGRNEASRLWELRLTAEESRFEALMATGKHKMLISELIASVDAAPLREERWIQLMLSLYRSGRQADALRTYRRLELHLDRELGIVPSPRTKALEVSMLLNSKDLDWTSRAATVSAWSTEDMEPPWLPKGNLRHQAHSFIGRHDLMRQIEEKLHTEQIVTLTGTAGVGKTRTAQQVAVRYAQQSGSEVWMVEMAGLGDDASTLSAIATMWDVQLSKGRTPADTLCDALHGRNIVLIVDNCEQILRDAGDAIAQLIGRCEGLRVLATSREKLGLAGECVVRIPQMTTPDGLELSPSALVEGSEAIQMLVDRARHRSRSFSLTTENSPAIVHICRLLNGIPLALEWAAANLDIMSVSDLAARLDHRLHLLNGRLDTSTPHHATLRSSIEWSFDLLSATERSAFLTCSVFVGTWSLSATERLCWAADLTSVQSVNALASLVDKSLIEVDSSGRETRYTMLETIRAFGQEVLDSDGTNRRDLLHAAHADHYRMMVSEWANSREPHRFHEVVDADYANVRSALQFFMENDAYVEALQVATALRGYWASRAFEATALLDQLLAQSIDTAPTALVALAHLVAGEVNYVAGSTKAEETLAEACRLAALTKDLGLQSDALSSLGSVVSFRGDPVKSAALADAARNMALLAGSGVLLAKALSTGGAAEAEANPTSAYWQFSEALKQFTALNDLWGISNCQCNLGLLDLQHSSIEAGTIRITRALVLAESSQFQSLANWCSLYLGLAYLYGRDVDAASSRFTGALRGALAHGLSQLVAHAVVGTAAVSMARGEFTRAARLFGAAESLRSVSMESWHPAEKVIIERDLDRLNQILGSEEVELANLLGRSLTWSESVSLALDAGRTHHDADASLGLR